MLNHSIVGRPRRRKQIAALLLQTSQHLQIIANVNADILEIEEGTRLVSIVSLLEKLSIEVEKEVSENGA
jgi:hypothetical protein